MRRHSKSVTRSRLRQLARLMNKQSETSIPVTNKLLDCFEVAIKDEECDFLLKTAGQPFSKRDAQKFTIKRGEEFNQFFEGMVRKGFIWLEREKGGQTYFRLAPIMVGWFEIFLSDGQETEDKREFARRVDAFFQSLGILGNLPWRYLYNFRSKYFGRPNKRIAVVRERQPGRQTLSVKLDQPLTASAPQVYSPESVYELLDKYSQGPEIALVHCFCRQWHKLVGENCRFELPSESCFALGKMGKMAVNYGIGRYISRQEAFSLIKSFQKRGVVHQVFHERDDLTKGEIGLCNCCWDCCGVIGSYSRGLLPLRFKSHYLAWVQYPLQCEECCICEEFCSVLAIKVVNGHPQIDSRKCLGCGQCELHCPQGVIALHYQEREVFLPLLKKSEARIKN